MKFGVILPSYLPSATVEGLRETVLRAEQLGYDSAWTTDHVMLPRALERMPYHSIFEAVSSLGWVAALTSRIKLGISVVVLPQRHPVLLAKELATLDVLSGGRMILGVGGGWCEPEFQFLNAEFHQRGRIYDEQIQVLRQLWTEPEMPFSGKYFNFADQSFAPGPAQAGGIPIWVGGSSDAALRRAARHSDGWHGNLAPIETFKERLAKLQSYGPSRKLLISARANVADERRETPGRAAMTYTLGGSPQDMLDDLRRYEDAGMEYLALGFWDGDQAKLMDRMTRFAERVMAKA
ncbi:MAG: TIGR03619 family F420-dependent LLM class oxidoreductase [Chloroflexi bacterium]|nr:TIGR03619 family F420-dependent LLM class oxidoreductase [Chloroflexota bacterium]